MNKSQLVEQIAKRSDLTLRQSASAVNAFIESVSSALGKGDSISLVGFGSFIVRQRAARTGVNPRTRQAVKIPAAKVPAFKPGKPLKERVNKKK